MGNSRGYNWPGGISPRGSWPGWGGGRHGYRYLPYKCFILTGVSIGRGCRQPSTMILFRGLLCTYLTVITLGSRGRKCPLTCIYSTRYNSCRCASGYWNHVPEVSPDITMFSITDSNMTQVPTGAFGTSPNLTTLHLDEDNIHVIADHAFEGLTQLTLLTLRKNKLMNLSKDTFSGLTNLVQIRLISNLLRVLPAEALCKMKNLILLDLSWNKLNDIHFGPCFEMVTHLSQLYLQGNSFNALSSRNFSGLCNIRINKLDMDSCQIRELSPNTFACLKKLKVLSLKNNNIRYLSNDMFKGLKMLHTLNIIGNPIAVFNSKLVTPLVNIQQLFIGSPEWTSLLLGPEFRTLSSLRRLRFEGMRMKTLTNDTLRSLVTCHIESLNFQNSHFHTVEPGSLGYFPRLKHLNLIATQFSQNLQEVLEGLISHRLETLRIASTVCGYIENIRSLLQAIHLSQLVLSDCGLKRISWTLFGNLTNLKLLDLSSNAISEAEEGSLRLLTSLGQLQLDENQLTTCPSGTWLGIGKKLKKLSLSSNLIQSLDGDSLAGYGSLQALDLSKNAIRKIFNQPFKHTPRLRHLILDNNKLYTLRYTALPQSLYYLRLKSNRLQTIAGDAFANLTSLERLDLSYNTRLGRTVESWKLALKGLHSLNNLFMGNLGISEVPTALLSNLTTLKALSLSGNAIASWDLKAFQPLTTLITLRLSANKITQVSEESFRYISDTLEEMDLSHNPFVCTCDLLWFRHYLMTGNVFFVSEGQAYACASPESLWKVPLLNFHISPYDCLDKMEIGASFGVFLTCLVFGVGTCLVLKYWWHIRYYWFVLQAQRKRQKELLHQPQYRFDAFVCYHRDDRHWVIRKLLPNIEYEGGYDVCLHDRDWLGGIDIAENILTSIDRSRKVIMVLTNKFAASQWCQFEVAMAQHRLLEEGRDVLVPVLMEKIEGRNLTARLRHVLNTKTYLAWPREENNEAKFWGALRKALKRRPRVI